VATHNSGTILIPAGTYRITKRLVLSKSNVVLKGEGPNSDGKHGGANGTVLFFPHSLSYVDGVDVEKHIKSGYVPMEIKCSVRYLSSLLLVLLSNNQIYAEPVLVEGWVCPDRRAGPWKRR
jgi:hypothetical protein